MPAIQSSFTKGELAPSLYGRVSTTTYQYGLRTARNVIIHPYGGVSNRPGLQFIGPVKAHTGTVRLIPFKFKGTDTYILEFGDLYMRVIRNDAHVVETAVNITAATKANPVVITAAAHGYANGDEVYLSGLGGMTELNGRRFIVASKSTNAFELTHQVTGANVDGLGYTTYTSGGTVARVYEIAIPYSEADLAELKFEQSADVITLTHPSYDPRELSRTDHDSWSLDVITFAPEQGIPTAVAATVNGAAGSTTYKYKVTAVADETFEESLPGTDGTAKTITAATKADPAVITAVAHGFATNDTIQITGIVGMTELNDRQFIVDKLTVDTFELRGEDSTDYAAYGSAGTANLTLVQVTNGNATLTVANNVTVSWTPPTGDAPQKYAVYRYDSGRFGLLGETEEQSYVDDGADNPDLGETPPRSRQPFIGADNKPATVSYYEQRRVFGGSNNKPDTSYYTQTGNQNNLTVASPARPDDAITATLNAREVNRIRHYVPLGDLVILTAGEEWKVNTGDNSGFTAETLKQKPQSRWGAGHQRPIVIGTTVLYTQENNAVVRSLGYTLEIDGYTGTDMTILANHLFERYTLLEWDYAKHPFSLVHTVRSDGVAPVLTFHQEQETVAWAHWDTKSPGKFKSVACIRPASTDTEDAAYFVVQRLVEGNVVQYIERTHSRRFNDIRDAFFVDSGLSLDSPVTITDVSLANPVVVTAAAHGFSDGDEVALHDILWIADSDDFGNETQPTDQLNGRRFLVSNKTTDTFELQDLDSVDIDGTAFDNAYVSDGTARKAYSSISGFNHLEGETLVALADGNVVRNLTVVEGVITLPRKFSRVHAGLPYVSDVELLDMALAGQQGNKTIQGLQKHASRVTVRVERSRGMLAGPNENKLTPWKQREFEAMGDPTAPKTGDVDLPLKAEWNSNGRVFFRQHNPLPLTILAAVPDIEMEGDDE